MRILIVCGLLLSVALALSACAGRPRETPTHEGGGADTMRLSPCVCLEIEDYDGSGFEWTG